MSIYDFNLGEKKISIHRTDCKTIKEKKPKKRLHVEWKEKINKRIELRADQKILKDQKEVEKQIKEIVPIDAEISEVIFDYHRSIVIIEAKKPGLVIGKQGSILQEIKEKTLWIPQVQRSSSIPSQITENIRAVLYQNNNTRKKFLNSVGKKIYKEWNPEKVDEVLQWLSRLYIQICALVSPVRAARRSEESCWMLPLTTMEDWLSSLSKTRRWEIRKGEQHLPPTLF